MARTFIPNKLVLIRPRDTPWFSNGLRRFRRKVHRLFTLAKKNPSEHNWDRYRSVRNEYKLSLDSAQNAHKAKIANSLASSRNSKQWWTTVKNMLGRGSDDTYPAMSHGNTYVTDNKDKATMFNSCHKVRLILKMQNFLHSLVSLIGN